MLNKKAAFSIYWFAYLALTVAVVYALWSMPSRMLDAAGQPYWTDAAITEQKIYTTLDEHDPVLGSQQGILTKDYNNVCYNNTIDWSMSQKAFAFRIYIDGKECYGNKKFYRDARPLAPVKYELFVSNKTYQTDKGPAVVMIEQVWPPKYEKIT
jgi:hypothetical protein